LLLAERFFFCVISFSYFFLQQRVFINDTNSYAITISGAIGPYINFVTITPQQYSGAIYYVPPKGDQLKNSSAQLTIENSQFNLNSATAIYVKKSVCERARALNYFPLVS
jgi:hypothetical protein